MKRKQKKRNKKKSNQSQQIKPTQYIREHARKSPVFECLIDEKWQESQFSPVVVSRKKKNGRLILGIYIVDMQCLGVKDTSYTHDMTLAEYEEHVESMHRNMGIIFAKIDPNLCFNIVYGAIEFAEDCGFQPHKDFRISKYILEDVESIEYEDVTFGVDGKPFFMAGPYDNPAKILATLEKNVGKGNFEFVMGSPGLDAEESYFEHPELDILFPPQLIEEKADSLGEEYARGLFNLQIDIASMAMTAGEYDIDTIEELYKNDPEFLEEIVDEVILVMNNESEKLSFKEKEEIESLTEWIIEKIIEHKGPEFLLADDYFPYYAAPDFSEIEKMSDEERKAEEEKEMAYMSKRGRDVYVIRRLFLISLEDKEGSLLKDEKQQEAAVNEFLKSLKEKLPPESWTDDSREYFYAIATETLEMLIEAEIDEEENE